MQIRLIRISAALAMLLLASCASVSVEKMRHTIPPQEGPKIAPDEILIRPFVVSNEALRVDRDSEELEEFKKELRDRLAQQTAERFKKHVANARVVAAGDTLPQGNFWLVSGEFQRVNQGSYTLLHRKVQAAHIGQHKQRRLAISPPREARRKGPAVQKAGHRLQACGGSAKE